MADTVYVNSVTLTDQDWFNDVNRLHYTILSDPADAAAVASPLSTKSTVASATTPNIFAVTVGQVIDYTGTATCTGFVAAPQAGAQRKLICAEAAVFTAGANMLISGVSSGNNFTAAANDEILVTAITTTQFRLTPLRYDGTSVTNNSVLMAEIATTSGSTADFTIPSWAKKIYVMLNGVSQNTAATDILIQLGDAGGIETTGYNGSTSNNKDGISAELVYAHTTGFIIAAGTAAAENLGGIATLVLQKSSTFTWALSSVISTSSGTSQVHIASGIKSTSAALTTVRLALEGAAAFDAGSVSVMYE